MIGDTFYGDTEGPVGHKSRIATQTDGLIAKLALGVRNINCALRVDRYLDITDCGASRHILCALRNPHLIGTRRKGNARCS